MLNNFFAYDVQFTLHYIVWNQHVEQSTSIECKSAPLFLPHALHIYFLEKNEAHATESEREKLKVDTKVLPLDENNCE